MTAKEYRSYAEDSTIRLPLGRVGPRWIGSLDRFVDELDESHPSAVDRVIERLTELTRNETPSGNPPRSASLTERAIAPCVHAARYPHLYSAHADLIRDLLGVEDEMLLDGESVELSQRRFIRVRYVPGYLKLVALGEAIGRESAIEFTKGYLDRMIADIPARPDGPETLAEFRDRQVAFNLEEQGMDWTQVVIDDHQYLNKVTVCRIQKVLADYEPKLMDVVACYPDFAMIRKTHPSFVLTRTQTLMNGGTCCDSCYHDARHVTGFEHPSLAAFDGLRT